MGTNCFSLQTKAFFPIDYFIKIVYTKIEIILKNNLRRDVLTVTDVIIIGAGTAGMTAAIYAVRAGLKTLVFDKSFYGGQITSATDIENYPGIERISGIDFSQKLYEQAQALGAEILF